MPTTKATEAEAPDSDFDEIEDGYEADQARFRQHREALAKAEAADPAAANRKLAVATVSRRRKVVDVLAADLRVARLELKAAEACLLALGPVPVVDDAPAAKKAPAKPAASLKAAARRSGQKHVE